MMMRGMLAVVSSPPNDGYAEEGQTAISSRF